MKPHELAAFLRAAASGTFDAYRLQMGRWYGEAAEVPTREQRELVRLLGLAAETLQEALWQVRTLYGAEAWPPAAHHLVFSAAIERCECGRIPEPMVGGGYICRNPIHSQEADDAKP
jgi:hypothetical protein